MEHVHVTRERQWSRAELCVSKANTLSKTVSYKRHVKNISPDTPFDISFDVCIVRRSTFQSWDILATVVSLSSVGLSPNYKNKSRATVANQTTVRFLPQRGTRVCASLLRST